MIYFDYVYERKCGYDVRNVRGPTDSHAAQHAGLKEYGQSSMLVCYLQENTK